MSLTFYLNNIHFALELTGAVVFLMAAWLMLDSYRLRREFDTLARTIGFGFCAIWQVIYAVNIGNDVLSYVGSGLLLVGLLLILVSFLKRQQLQMQAVVVIPSFNMFANYLHIAAMALSFSIAFASFHKARKEFNKTWIPFSLAFLFLGLAAFVGVFEKGSYQNLVYITASALELLGFIVLAHWAWQYLQLRIRESLVLILISAALLLSTIVTLAFSTILIGQIASETDKNLLTDARVLDLNVQSLQEVAEAKAALISRDPTLSPAIASNDFTNLEQAVERYMEEHKLGFVTITDQNGNVLVRAHALSRRGDSLLGERAVEEARLGNTFVTIEKSPVEKLSIRAGAPVVDAKKKIVGLVIAGYPLDNALVDNIKRVTGLDMFIYDGDVSSAATAFAEDGRTRLTGATIADEEVKTSVLKLGKTVTAQAELYGRPFRASYLPLHNGDDKIIGMISAAKPQQDILDVENATNRLTLVTVIIIMLVLSWPIYAFTRRLTQPV